MRAQHDSGGVEGEEMPPKSNILITQCCQCLTWLGVKPAGEAEGGVSHGYCQICLDLVMEAMP